MKAWIARYFTPTAVGVIIGGIATFAGTQGVNYYYFERTEAAAELAEARVQIAPFLDPLPKSLLETKERIRGLKAKRILFKSQVSKGLFASAILHLDELQAAKAKTARLRQRKRFN